MPPPRTLQQTIEDNTTIATFALAEQMVDQGRKARMTFLAIHDFPTTAILAEQIVPDEFVDELFEAAEDTLQQMATYSFGYAVDTLPAGYPTNRITEVGRQAAVRGVLDDVAAHMVTPNQIVRERVRSAIIDSASKEHTVAQVADRIEMIVGDLVAKDGRFIPAHKRSRTIARTETAWASGKAETEAWKMSEVTLVSIFDGDGCGWNGHDDPDLADGKIVQLSAYEAQILSHPHCVRTAAPLEV